MQAAPWVGLVRADCYVPLRAVNEFEVLVEFDYQVVVSVAAEHQGKNHQNQAQNEQDGQAQVEELFATGAGRLRLDHRI